MKNSFHTDHTLIIDELETSIKFHNLDLILGFLPKGSYLVGGYLRDIILGRKTEKLDVDIVVPLNAIEIGKKIANNIGLKFAGPVLTDNLFIFCKFFLEMNLLRSLIKLLQRSLSNFLINNLSDSRLLFFLYPKPKELSVL